jgi:FKBP-type peptidyl-prolyl cis-trans isomerase
MKKSYFPIIAIFVLSVVLVVDPRAVISKRENPRETAKVTSSRIQNYNRKNLETLGEKLTELKIDDIMLTNLNDAKQEVDFGDKIRVNYIGWRANDGFIFDESFNHGEGGFTFTVGEGVIQGWSSGVIGMKVGDVRMLKIPSNLGYGETGSGENIPANTDLIFVVELLEYMN